MLKDLLKNKKFLKITKKFLEMPEILDIILFGSAIRGKEKPKDIDILIIYTKNAKDIIEINYKLRKELEKILKNIEIVGKKYKEIFSPEFLARESVLSEGFSMRQGKFISESLGFRNLVLFKYSLKRMSKSKRMLFYYSLHGRNKQGGILKSLKAYKFSDSIILSRVESSEIFKEFFNKWGIEFLEMPVLIPERVANRI